MERVDRRIAGSDLFWTALLVFGMIGACGVITAGLLRFSPALVAAAVCALLGCAAILRFPYAGIILFMGLLAFRPEQHFPILESMRLSLLLSAFTLFAWLIQVMLGRETFRPRVELGWMVLFAAALALSALRSTVSGAFETGITDAAKLAALFVLFQQLPNSEARLYGAMHWLLAFNVYLALHAAYGWYTGSMVMMEHGQPRAIVANGNYDDPNDLAAALVVSVPLALCLLTSGRFWSRLWGGLALAALLTTVFLTYSRGGMMAAVAGMTLFCGHRFGWVRTAIVGSVLLVALMAIGPDRFTAESLEGDDSTLGRIYAWEAGLGMLAASPLLGVGYEKFIVLHGLAPHNSLVQVSAEGGLLGAVAWVGLNYWAALTLVRVWRRRREADEDVHAVVPPKESASPELSTYAVVLLAGLVASLVAQFFLHHAYRPQPLIPVALAAAFAVVAGVTAREKQSNWAHFLAVPAVTLLGIGFIWAAVVTGK
ncbi:MAG: O-antigen ligase family protein [Armatimonadota bacterium]